MFLSQYIKTNQDGNDVLIHPDKREVRLSGLVRVHFYRLLGTTPENATDEQVLEFFDLRGRETSEGKLLTTSINNESAADMVSRELKIVNFQQVMGNTDQQEFSLDAPEFISEDKPNVGKVFQKDIDDKKTNHLPPIPRYKPNSNTQSKFSPENHNGILEETVSGNDNQSDSIQSNLSRFLRQENNALFIQTPNGEEERVTNYMRIHFERMLEKDILSAKDEDIETWWNLQGSLEPGISMKEARSQNLLSEALKAAGKLKDQELLVLNETLEIWLEARGHKST